MFKKIIINLFHKLYYSSQTWTNTFYFGIKTYKNPLDMWIYQELVYKLKPDVIVETGTFKGGSALFLAHLCDNLGKGKVITIDNMQYDQRIDDKMFEHQRIRFIEGSSTDKKVVEQVKKLTKNKNVLVILDSDHSKQHVLSELNIYSKLVKRGGYIVVEDTNVNGHPVRKKFGDGPYEAVTEFLKKKTFTVDKTKEKFLFTFNPNGFLIKK